MASPLTGRCLCGEVRYCAGPLLYPATLCHCASCRRASGAHALGWFTVRVADLAWTGTEPRRYASSPGVLRTFCGRCGGPLTYQSDKRPDEVDITIGTLDAPAGTAPADHIYMEDAVPWDRPADGLPQFMRTRA
jgi:hypothetical protein